MSTPCNAKYDRLGRDRAWSETSVCGGNLFSVKLHLHSCSSCLRVGNAGNACHERSCSHGPGGLKGPGPTARALCPAGLCPAGPEPLGVGASPCVRPSVDSAAGPTPTCAFPGPLGSPLIPGQSTLVYGAVSATGTQKSHKDSVLTRGRETCLSPYGKGRFPFAAFFQSLSMQRNVVLNQG